MLELKNELVNEETMEGAAEELVVTDAKTGFAKKAVVGAVVAAVIVGGVALYKKVIKPKLAQRKANKEAQAAIDAEAEVVNN